MYYDLKFPFRISAEAGIVQDKKGNNDEAYILTTLGGCKVPTPEEKYNEFHESQRQCLADMLGINVDLITCISGKEYEANADDEGEGNLEWEKDLTELD